MPNHIMTTCPTCGTPHGLADQVHDLCVAVLCLQSGRDITPDSVTAIQAAKDYIKSGIQRDEQTNFYQGVK